MKLTPEEKDFIKQNEVAIEEITALMKIVQQFKLDDYLIAFHERNLISDGNRKRPVTNSYGAVKKFQVVAVDSNGIPYIKELSKKGNPVGRLISSIQWAKTGRDHHSYHSMPYMFEIDPDYTDSIILDDQENYSATGIIKEKSDTFKAIAAHNKSLRISMKNDVNVTLWLKTVKVGDTFWRSNTTAWTITEINPIPKRPGRNNWDVSFMKVITNNGKSMWITFSNLLYIALYTAQPRTFKELRDPK